MGGSGLASYFARPELVGMCRRLSWPPAAYGDKLLSRLQGLWQSRATTRSPRLHGIEAATMSTPKTVEIRKPEVK